MSDFGLGVCTGLVVEMMKTGLRVLEARKEVPHHVIELLRAELLLACQGKALAEQNGKDVALLNQDGSNHHQQKLVELKEKLKKMGLWGYMMGDHDKVTAQAKHHEGMAAQYALAQQGQMETNQILKEFHTLTNMFKQQTEFIRYEVQQSEGRLHGHLQCGFGNMQHQQHLQHQQLMSCMQQLQQQNQMLHQLLLSQAASNAAAGTSAAPQTAVPAAAAQIAMPAAAPTPAEATAAQQPVPNLSEDPRLGSWLEELARVPSVEGAGSGAPAAVAAVQSGAAFLVPPAESMGSSQATGACSFYPTVYPTTPTTPQQPQVPNPLFHAYTPSHVSQSAKVHTGPTDAGTGARSGYSNAPMKQAHVLQLQAPLTAGPGAVDYGRATSAVERLGVSRPVFDLGSSRSMVAPVVTGWPAASFTPGHGGPPQLTQRSAPVHKCKGCSGTCKDCRLLLRNCKQRIVRLGTGLGARKFYCLRDLSFGRQCSTLGREGPQCNSCLAFQEVNPHLKNDAGYFIPLVTIAHAAATAGASALHCGRTSPSRRDSTIICQFCHQCSSCKRLEALVLTRP